MSAGGHSDLGPELRQLAQALLDRIDPALRAAAAMAGAQASGTPGKCQQVWCPVCALAALATGDEHPLLTVVAEHSAALLAVVRALVEEGAGGPEVPEPPSGPPAGTADPDDTAAPSGTGRYQPIPIVVEE